MSSHDQNLKQRRSRSRIGNFGNTKNSTEDKLRERKESAHLEEEKLETVREKFDLCLRQLIEYEELNIFSRDSNSEGNAISNFLIENEILHQILLQYKKVISEEKESYCSVQARFVSLVGEMNENAMNLNNLLADIEIFYSEMDAEFVNEERFRSKLIEKLNKLNEEMKILSPLIFGKNMECESVLKIANQLSLIYSSIQLEKKQYWKIKKELKKHQHHTLTNNNNNNNDDNISKYKMTDLKQIEIENEIRKLRKKKCETMKKLIDKVYGRKYKKNNLKELKLKQVLLHYNESIIDDNKIHLKLESELLEMQCEEFQNELILLEKKKETNQAKQLQLSNAINIYNQNQNESDHDFNQNSAKQISRHALTQLHKLQKLERDQRKAMHLMEREIFKIEKSLKEEKEKQKLIKNNIFKKVNKNKNKKKREREKCFDLDDNKNKKERKLLEAQFNKNKQLIEEKRKCLNDLKKESEETVLNKSELQRMSHQYQNSIVSHKYLSQNALRKNGEALEFLSEINFLNKEYEIQMDQINNKYREKQTFLKNKFISDFNNKIKKNTKNRQTQIEQESYNIIQERKDKELIDLTQMINEQQIKQNLSSQMQSRYKAAKFCNKSKAVKIKFGKQTIVSSINDIDTNDANINALQIQNDVLRAIKFEWNEDTNKSQHEHQTDIDIDIDQEVDIGHTIIAQLTDFEQEQDDISTDLSFDDGQQPDLEIDANVANYKNLILQINNGNIDICNCLNKQMNIDEDEDEDDDENNENESNIENDGYGDIAVQHLKFDNINMVKELLINWTCLTQPNAVK